MQIYFCIFFIINILTVIRIATYIEIVNNKNNVFEQ